MRFGYGEKSGTKYTTGSTIVRKDGKPGVGMARARAAAAASRPPARLPVSRFASEFGA